nr:uncharacterized protein LOC113821284 [Penaeus vannamei]
MSSQIIRRNYRATPTFRPHSPSGGDADFTPESPRPRRALHRRQAPCVACTEISRELEISVSRRVESFIPRQRPLGGTARLPSAPKPVRIEARDAEPTPSPRVRVPNVFPRTDRVPASARVGPASPRLRPAGRTRRPKQSQAASRATRDPGLIADALRNPSPRVLIRGPRGMNQIGNPPTPAGRPQQIQTATQPPYSDRRNPRCGRDEDPNDAAVRTNWKSRGTGRACHPRPPPARTAHALPSA